MCLLIFRAQHRFYLTELTELTLVENISAILDLDQADNDYIGAARMFCSQQSIKSLWGIVISVRCRASAVPLLSRSCHA